MNIAFTKTFVRFLDGILFCCVYMTSFLLLIFSGKITFGATEVIFMGNTGFFFFLRYHLALFNLDTDRKTEIVVLH